jgi:hypothetical protein
VPQQDLYTTPDKGSLEPNHLMSKQDIGTRIRHDMCFLSVTACLIGAMVGGNHRQGIHARRICILIWCERSAPISEAIPQTCHVTETHHYYTKLPWQGILSGLLIILKCLPFIERKQHKAMIEPYRLTL